MSMKTILIFLFAVLLCCLCMVNNEIPKVMLYKLIYEDSMFNRKCCLEDYYREVTQSDLVLDKIEID